MNPIAAIRTVRVLCNELRLFVKHDLRSAIRWSRSIDKRVAERRKVN